MRQRCGVGAALALALGLASPAFAREPVQLAEGTPAPFAGSLVDKAEASRLEGVLAGERAKAEACLKALEQKPSRVPGWAWFVVGVLAGGVVTVGVVQATK